MSKIEEALEKAINIRQTKQDSKLPETQEAVKDLPKFIPAECIIDQEKINKYLVCISEPFSLAAEQFKKLRARVLQAVEKNNHKTILITSSEMGEGKTITALNLAVTMAQEIDYTVLLVDSDLRNPSIHRYLGIEPARGLSDVLKGEASLGDVLINTGIGKMVFLPAGNPSENSTELLSSERMRSLVRELKQRYADRYIIFDSPPILLTADSLSLGKYIDSILFVVQEGRVSQKNIQKAVSLMKGWNILGVVFNNVPGYLLNGNYSYYRYGAGQKK